MRLRLAATVSLLAAAAAFDAAASAAEEYDAVDLRMTGVVGLIDIETADVDRVSVTFEPGEGLAAAPQFAVREGELHVTQLSDGARRMVWAECRDPESAPEMRFIDRPHRFWGRAPNSFRRSSGDGDPGVALNEFHPVADYGRWVIRVPAAGKVTVAAGGVTGRIGDVAELDLEVGYCGDVAVGDVAGDARIAISGTGDVMAGAIGGALTASVNGVGDIGAGRVAQGLDAQINGVGDIEVAAVEGGDIDAAIHGAGDIAVLAGEAERLRATIHGVGDVSFRGVAFQVDSEIYGAGDIYVNEVQGGVNGQSMGAGRVHVLRDERPS
jgi:hypothetical protein